ncbi:uncharacterized protein FPRN_11878 [Fusarium proliferatum]|nr:uncharacterized protein FPRN_11878 [Fusarium proliferatum]
MSQQSISQPTGNENASLGPTIVSVESRNELKKVLQDLNELRAKPTPIYLDAMGIAKDELIDLHLFVPSNRTLYTVNVRKLGDVAFSAVGNCDMSLGVLLETTNIPKVGFDVRDISRVLFHQFNVSLAEVHDIQLMELASRKDGQQKKYLSGLARCIDQDVSNGDPDKVRWLNPANAKDLRFYQKFGHAPYWIMKRVEIFPSLFDVYNTKLSRLDSACWLRLAEQESEQRVHDAKRKSKKRTEKKSWGPEVFWDDQQKQTAKDAWKESIMLNALMGDIDISNDNQ